MPPEPSYLVGRYSEIENEIDNLDVPVNAAPGALKWQCRVPLQCKSYVHENDYVVYSSLLVAICVELNPAAVHALAKKAHRGLDREAHTAAVDALLRLADVDADGRVSEDDFVAYVRDAALL